MQFAGGYADDTQGDRYHLRARNYDPGTGRFDSTDPAPAEPNDPAIAGYAYAENRPTSLTDPSGMVAVADGGGSSGNNGSSTTFGDPNGYVAYYTCMADPACRAQQEADLGAVTGGDDMVENPEYASAKKLVDEAEGFVKQIGDEIVNLILDLVGFNDAKACVTEGDIVACISTALQAVPWGKLFKAAKVMIKAIGVGRRLIEAYGRLRSARSALESIPRYIKKAGDSADELADSKKYANQVRNAVDDAKGASGKAKETARKAADAKKKAKKSESCPVNSFAAGTRVVMANGTAKAIDTLAPGDAVLATDPATGRTEPQQVTAAITGSGDKRLVDLTLVGAGAGGGGPPAAESAGSAKGGRVTATDGHPFWTFERGWVRAGDLKAGEHLRDVDGQRVLVAATAARAGRATVHNVTVNDQHTYYVRTADGTTALNHNESLRGKAGKAACDFEKWKARNGEGGYTVYHGYDKNGKKVYAGITTNLGRRQGQHIAKKYGIARLEAVSGATNLTKWQARAIEQVLIERVRASGLSRVRNGIPIGQNNSISPKRSFYGLAVRWGEDFLGG
jgi:RHS repeat-associated protein